MPIPTLAFWIMATSLAPSPMAKVMWWVCVVTMPTTSAFCSGDTRQQMTERQLVQSARNSRHRSYDSAYVRVFPSTTSANSLSRDEQPPDPPAELMLRMYSLILSLVLWRREQSFFISAFLAFLCDKTSLLWPFCLKISLFSIFTFLNKTQFFLCKILKCSNSYNYKLSPN